MATTFVPAATGSARTPLGPKNILINNFFSGSSSTNSSCTPVQVYRDLVPARLELDGGVHSRFEERWGVGDTMGKVVVHRPGGGRGVKHYDQVGQMEWIGMARHFAKAESRKQVEVLERGSWWQQLLVMGCTGGPGWRRWCRR